MFVVLFGRDACTHTRFALGPWPVDGLGRVAHHVVYIFVAVNAFHDIVGRFRFARTPRVVFGRTINNKHEHFDHPAFGERCTWPYSSDSACVGTDRFVEY